MRTTSACLVSILIAASAALGINDELVTEIDFEDFEIGAGKLAPTTGSKPTSVFSFRTEVGALPADEFSGIVEFSSFNKGKQAYLTVPESEFGLQEIGDFFSAGFFGGISQELPGATPVVNLVDRGTPILVTSVDFYYEKRGENSAEEIRFYLFDAVDGDDTSTFDFHSFVALLPDGSIRIADLGSGPWVPVEVPSGTFVPSQPYRMILVADYEKELWWASLVNLASGSTTSLAASRPLISSGYTNPEGSFDIALTAFKDVSEVSTNDRLYLDNYRVVIRPSLPIEISAEVRQSVTLRFESFPGRRYRVLTGSNLNDMEPVGEPFFGTGEIIERSFLVNESGVFFRVVESGD